MFGVIGLTLQKIIEVNGNVAEWFKAAVLKTADAKNIREFESHRFLQGSASQLVMAAV